MWLSAAVIALLLLGCGDGSGAGTADARLVATPDARDENAPPPSAGHTLVWADDLERVLLVNAGLGGLTSPPEATPTRVWAWDGTAWAVLDASGPPIRNLAGVAYDTTRHILVMHGGSYDIDTTYGETWEWSMAGGWRMLSGTNPGVLDHTMMAYDAERGRMVLFGGGRSPTVASRETWEHDGVAWTRVATTGPAARVHHAMEYDPVAKRVVVFGGYNPPGQDLGDSWSWNGTTWTKLADDVTARTHARMVFHAGMGALLVVGGTPATRLGTLALRSGAWTPFNLSPEPRARYLTGAAYDATRGVVVLFGGGDPAGTTLFADTWELDGQMWREP